MLRHAIGTLCLAALSGAATLAPAQIPPTPGVELSGRYKIVLGTGPNAGGDYGGEVGIVKSGGCYLVTWTLENGSRYYGVGMLLEHNAFAVAYSSAGQTSYGVVAYTAKTGFSHGYRGEWCQQDGTRRHETLGPPATLAGRHSLQGGTDRYTGTLDVKDTGEFDANAPPWNSFQLAWHTSAGDYSGYGIGCCDKFLIAAWGPDAQGGIVFYTVEKNQLVGEWSVPGAPGVGHEVLDRVARPGKPVQ